MDFILLKGQREHVAQTILSPTHATHANENFDEFEVFVFICIVYDAYAWLNKSLRKP